MGTPTLDVDVQPRNDGKAYYLPIGAPYAGQPALVKIVLRLEITNTMDRHVVVETISFSFPDSNVDEIPMVGVKKALDRLGIDDDPPPRPDGTPAPTLQPGWIPKDGTARWSNGLVKDHNDVAHRNEVYLAAPAPPKIRVNIFCEGFTDPYTTETMDLIPYVSPTAKGALLMPFAKEDLDDGEYIITAAEHWANGGASGSQIFAHDIEIQKKVDGEWTRYNRTDVTTADDANEDHRVWGKPVRALADGRVESFRTHIADNDPPGDKDSTTPNFIKIIHDDITVEYLHLQKDSIPAELMTKDANDNPNATVLAGDIVGLAGNSGRSSHPHLHLEAEDTSTGTLRGLPFKRASVIRQSEMRANGRGPWVILTADGVSREDSDTGEKVAIWPGYKFDFGPDLSDIELDELAGEIFGGVAKGGDGFIFVNGKLKRVPPRGIKGLLLRLQSWLS
mgnify:CR=1 FL=1